MNVFTIRDNIARAAEFIHRSLPAAPVWAVTLGSGLGGLSDFLANPVSIPYGDIPGFPEASVKGHAGRLVFGKLAGIPVILMEGRFHYYEGHRPDEVTLPFRALIKLGVSRFFLTNAAGGLKETLPAGTLMLIRDHINLMGFNPLMGKNLDEFGPRFPAMTEVYSARLGDICRRCAEKHDVSLAEGVYLAVTGPSYETPAEIRMMRELGADAVGMSTVPEALVIRHAGKELVAVSLITNCAALPAPPSHEEVVETARKMGKRLHEMILCTIQAAESGKNDG